MATKKSEEVPTSTNYLHQALAVSGTAGARGNTYGSADENFQRIANLMTAQLGLVSELPNSGCLTRALAVEDVALLMIMVKTSRLANNPVHADSWTDIAGYVNCASTIHNGDTAGWERVPTDEAVVLRNAT